MKLQRIAILVNVPSEELNIDPLRQELSKKASRLLGYGLLENHLVVAPKQQLKLATVAKVYADLDIKPYSNRDVERYKRSERRRQNRKSFFALPLYAKFWVMMDKVNDFLMPNENMEILVSVLAVLGNIAALIFTICYFVDRSATNPAAMELHVVKWLSLFCLFGGIEICKAALDKPMRKHVREIWKWSSMQFGHCHNSNMAIPDFALDTAVRIKERMPDADLYVDCLEGTQFRLGRVWADPFLVQKVEGNLFYLEVWEENKFEAMHR